MRWFHQKQGWGLGNFIMATPALQLLFKKNKKKVNIFFDDRAIKELYREAIFLNILEEKPTRSPFAICNAPKKKKRETDSEAFCRILLKDVTEIPNTYVDDIKTFKLDRKKNRKYVAVFHGSLNVRPLKLRRKDLGNATRQDILNCLIENKFIPVLLGSKSDNRLFWNKNIIYKSVPNYIGKLSLKDSVSVLNQCDYFISNDTGLYHVAGALKKSGLVLWRDTCPVKNRSTFDGITHVINKQNNKRIAFDAIRRMCKEWK